MNFKVLIRLLFLLTITISFRPNTAKPFSVLANVDKSAELVASNNKFDGMKSTSILYGIANLASRHSQAPNQCHRQLNQIYDGINRKEIWAIKALDSSAMPMPGFVIGHNYWLGSIEGCKAVQQQPLSIRMSNRFERFTHNSLWSEMAPFDIDYRMVYAEHRSSFQIQVEFFLEKNKILHVGLCLPRSCSNDEIANLTQEFFNSSTLIAQMMHNHRPNVLLVKDLNPKTNLLDKWSFRLIGLCVIFTLVMMVIAHLRERSESDGATRTGNPFVKRSETNDNAPSGLVNDSISIPRDNCIKEIVQTKSFINDIVKSFSLRKNVNTLMSGKKPANAVPIVDGLKSVGCLVLVVFHVIWFNYFTVHNGTMTFSYGEQAPWQWITTAPIIVDVFFTISGLLFTYNFLRNQSKLDEIKTNSLWQNVKLFVKQLLHRYIRLTPLCLIVIICMDCLTSRLTETSPFWVHIRNDLNCSKYWWRNLLYIQNFDQFDKMCVKWTWSLACEMQFTMLSTVLLFIYAKCPQAGRKIFYVLVAICIGLLFSIAILTKFAMTYDVVHSLANEMYVAPWTRMLPYLVGIAAGYAMYMLNGKLPLNAKTIKMIWIMATMVVTFCHLMPAKRDAPYILNAILLTAIRVLYPASISWMILASHSGHGGRFAQFFNHPIFVHINKLAYGIYLLNPVVITALYGWQSHNTHINPVSMIAMTTGINVFVYLTAMVFSLMFEIPYVNISAIIMRQSTSRTMMTSSLQPTELMEAKKVQ